MLRDDFLGQVLNWGMIGASCMRHSLEASMEANEVVPWLNRKMVIGSWRDDAMDDVYIGWLGC